MSNNIPILLIGGGIAVASVYFLTKSKDVTTSARDALQSATGAGGRLRLKTVSGAADPPLKGAQVAEVCNVVRAPNWSKTDPKFVLDCDSGVAPGFTHLRAYTDSRSGSPMANQLLYQPGPNPRAPYPSDFVETSQGIASILGTVGQAATSIFQSQANFKTQKMQMSGGGMQQPQVIMAPAKSNTALIAVILIGGVGMAAMMYHMMNQGATV